MQKNIGIFYFSGTGNTEIIMNLLGNELIKNGAKVDFVRIEDIVKDRLYYNIEEYDIVGIGYPVYAFNAPKIVFDFIKAMPRTQDKYTFVFKVLGDGTLSGGSITPVKNKLRERGYDLFHESSFILSSNIFKKYPDELVRQLYNTAVDKVKDITEEILTGKMRRQKNGTYIRAISWIVSKFENIGASIFGKDLKASKKCSQCNKCVKNCPAGNIRMEGLKIKFGWKCIWCMRCVYKCPQRAISPGVLKFTVIKEPYNIQEIIDNPDLYGEYVTKSTKGYYKKFKSYIFDED